MNELDVQVGMSVRGTDGADLGTVTEVWPFTQGYGYISRTLHETSDYGPVSGMGDTMTTEHGYFHAKQPGVGGFGSHDLYVPYADVQDVAPGDVVMLTVATTVDESDGKYGTRPEELKSGLYSGFAESVA